MRLKRAIERPIEVTVTGKGVDAVTTELCVTAPWDAGGHARPRVLLDVTHALRQLGIMVFKADIHTARIPGRPLQEIHRFLLTDSHGQPIDDPLMRDKVVKKARRGREAALCLLCGRTVAQCAWGLLRLGVLTVRCVCHPPNTALSAQVKGSLLI